MCIGITWLYVTLFSSLSTAGKREYSIRACGEGWKGGCRVCSCRHRVNTACFGAIWEGSHPLASLLPFTLSSAPAQWINWAISFRRGQREEDEQFGGMLEQWNVLYPGRARPGMQVMSFCHKGGSGLWKAAKNCVCASRRIMTAELPSGCYPDERQTLLPLFSTSVIFAYLVAEWVITVISDMKISIWV